MHKETMVIAGEEVAPGEEKLISPAIARLPSHTNIDIPVYVSRSTKPGPTLLLMGGLHGDEINGIEIVRQMIDLGYARPQCGTTICIPILNIFGFINFSRAVPDGKDVNRSFPGNRHGSLAGRVAYYLMKEIIPLIDYGVDFHTGGAARTNYPQVRCVLKDAKNKELAAAFAAPFTLDSPFRPSSLRQAADKLGKKILVYEGGESARFDYQAIEMGIAGTRRLMKHLGMTDQASDPISESVKIKNSSWVRARAAGLFHTKFKGGEFIKKNEVLGDLTDPFGEFKVQVKSRQSGYILGLNNNPVVNQGDALMHLGLKDKLK